MWLCAVFECGGRSSFELHIELNVYYIIKSDTRHGLMLIGTASVCHFAPDMCRCRLFSHPHRRIDVTIVRAVRGGFSQLFAEMPFEPPILLPHLWHDGAGIRKDVKFLISSVKT